MTHAIYLRTLGAEVILTDVSEPRLRFAADSKVGAALDASRSDVPSEVRRMTGGRGTDLAMVASGSPRAISQAVKSVRRGGVVCLFGIPVRDSMLECSISDVYNSDLSIVSSYGATERDTAAALAALSSGKVDLSRLVTHRFALSDFQKGVEAAVSGEAMKVVITP
jgi:L-iditol 2-dehydrogenase